MDPDDPQNYETAIENARVSLMQNGQVNNDIVGQLTGAAATFNQRETEYDRVNNQANVDDIRNANLGVIPY